MSVFNPNPQEEAFLHKYLFKALITSTGGVAAVLFGPLALGFFRRANVFDLLLQAAYNVLFICLAAAVFLGAFVLYLWLLASVFLVARRALARLTKAGARAESEAP